MAQKSINMTDETISKIEELAQQERRNFSNMVAILLEEALDNRTEGDGV